MPVGGINWPGGLDPTSGAWKAESDKNPNNAELLKQMSEEFIENLENAKQQKGTPGGQEAAQKASDAGITLSNVINKLVPPAGDDQSGAMSLLPDDLEPMLNLLPENLRVPVQQGINLVQQSGLGEAIQKGDVQGWVDQFGPNA